MARAIEHKLCESCGCYFFRPAGSNRAICAECHKPAAQVFQDVREWRPEPAKQWELMAREISKLVH